MKNCVVLDREQNPIGCQKLVTSVMRADFGVDETDMFDRFLAQERLGTPDIDCDVPNKK